MHQGIRDELAQGFKRKLRNIANVAIVRLDCDTAHVCPKPRHRRGQEPWDRSVQRGDVGCTDPRVDVSDVSRANDELEEMFLWVGTQRENSCSRKFTGGGGDSGPAKAFDASECSKRRPSELHLISPRSEQLWVEISSGGARHRLTIGNWSLPGPQECLLFEFGQLAVPVVAPQVGLAGGRHPARFVGRRALGHSSNNDSGAVNEFISNVELSRRGQ